MNIIRLNASEFPDEERAIQRIQLLAMRIYHVAPILMESMQENSDAAMMDSCQDGAQEITKICEALLKKSAEEAAS